MSISLSHENARMILWVICFLFSINKSKWEWFHTHSFTRNCSKKLMMQSLNISLSHLVLLCWREAIKLVQVCYYWSKWTRTMHRFFLSFSVWFKGFEADMMCTSLCFPTISISNPPSIVLFWFSSILLLFSIPFSSESQPFPSRLFAFTLFSLSFVTHFNSLCFLFWLHTQSMRWERNEVQQSLLCVL